MPAATIVKCNRCQNPKAVVLAPGETEVRVHCALCGFATFHTIAARPAPPPAEPRPDRFRIAGRQISADVRRWLATVDRPSRQGK
jgi:hypothetical protein